MQSRCTLAALLLFACVGLLGVKAEPPKPPIKPKEVKPVEIDFSPLPGIEQVDQYKIHLTVRAESGVGFEDTFTIERTPVSSVRNFVKRSMQTVDWKVTTLGDDKLLIEGHRGSPVRSVDIKVEGLPSAKTPVVRGLPKTG